MDEDHLIDAFDMEKCGLMSASAVRPWHKEQGTYSRAPASPPLMPRSDADEGSRDINPLIARAAWLLPNKVLWWNTYR